MSRSIDDRSADQGRRARPRSFLAVAALSAALLAGPTWSAVEAQEPTLLPSVGPAASPEVAPTPIPSPVAGPLAGIELLVRGERDPDLVVPDEDLAAAVHGNTAFALDLYRQLASQSGNLVTGPLSISFAMAMNQMGARRATETQAADAMHFDLPPDRLAAAFDQLSREFAGLAGPKVTVSLVDQLFGQRAYPFEEPFLATLSSHFGAPMAVVDYADPEAVRQLINDWVASQTNERITDLVPPGALSTLTRLVLVNAMYLKADWAAPFNAAFTTDRSFRLASGKKVKVPTMSMTTRQAVARGNGYRAIELAYDGDRLAMLIVVPSDLAGFEAGLTSDAYDAIVGSLEQDTVALTMPTFSARSSVGLTEPLKALGITDMFDPALADLSGISPEPGLHVGAAVHQAFVKVAEQGTEAAAATAIGDTGTSGPPPAFKVDRPFLWFIRDRGTGSILFMGRVTDPRDIVE
ncbi:MAG: serpin family protein [Chloroflexi bacterium]|nr:serpin family protein [Chloroflexota bacterium]